MNIKDIVHYDERSEAIIEKRYANRIDSLLEKFNFARDNIVFIEKKQALIDEKDKLISYLKDNNIPICDERLLIGMAIEWAETNGYTSFTQAQKEVLDEIANDGKEFNGDLLQENDTNYNHKYGYSDLTLEEAKRMYNEAQSINPISESFIKESLMLFKRSMNLESSKDYKIYFDNNECYFSDGDKKYIIPTIAIRKFVAAVKGIRLETDSGKKLIEQLNSLEIPYLCHSWPNFD